MILRYTLFQVPGAALLVVLLIIVQRWVDLPAWFIWGIVALWVAKDVILFPFLWRAYDWDRSRDENSMVGLRGRAAERLAPSGYVKVRGEMWLGEVMEGERAVEREEGVRVQGMRGLTLLVTPENEEPDSLMGACQNTGTLEAVGKCADARRAKS